MGILCHFLNVGSGDCTIIDFPKRIREDGSEQSERVMMVDICHHEDHQEYENIINYYKTNFKKDDGSLKPIFRFICTHPHQDHICGLYQLLNDYEIRIFNIWDLNHKFLPEDFNHYPTHEDDWDAYEELRDEDLPATVIRTQREDTPSRFWNEDEDRITILSPSKSLIEYAHYKQNGTKRESHEVEIDEMSYALKIQINENKVILSGDGRASPCWDDIYQNCKNQIKNCSVLKAGHHGQEAGFHEEAVKLMNPKLIIFSNSKDLDDANGAESLYRIAVPDAVILRTWETRTIVVDIPFENDEQINYYTQQ